MWENEETFTAAMIIFMVCKRQLKECSILLLSVALKDLLRQYLICVYYASGVRVHYSETCYLAKCPHKTDGQLLLNHYKNKQIEATLDKLTFLP
jgi:hypothetical protein